MESSRIQEIIGHKKYYVIYDNLDTICLNENGKTLNQKIIYFIKSELCSFSASKKHAFYSYTLFDEANTLVEDNTIYWQNIKCKIHKDEVWDLVKKPNHKSVALIIEVKDKLKNKEIIKIDNAKYKSEGTAIKEMAQYLQKLNK